MRKSFVFFFLSGFIFFSFCFGFSLYSQSTEEEILSFHSDIEVHSDASMTVRETIKVRSTGNQIKRGIYRDFPTRYRDRYGNRYVVEFTVLGILRDGKPESYHLEGLSNGKRVYIGRKDARIPPGVYTYTIAYKTNRQLGFFDNYDELYWNVTGNGWSFPIRNVSATVRLPYGAFEKTRILKGYTGRQGSGEENFIVSEDTPPEISFAAARPLGKGEGLTIVVSWDKGYVTEPDVNTKIGYFIHDNAGVLTGLIGIVILLAYYLIVWHLFGRDPQKGVVIPLYGPPDAFSPAAMRYIMKMGFDNKVFASCLIDMAVKGYLTISEEAGTFTIKKHSGDQAVLTKEEKVVALKLLGPGKEITLVNTNHTTIGGAFRSLRRALKNKCEQVYFFTNKQYFIPGLLLSVIVMVASGAIQAQEKLPIAVFLCIWLTIWSFGVFALLGRVVSLWRGSFTAGLNKTASAGGALVLTLFALPFLIGEAFGIGMLVYATSFSMLIVLAAVVFLNVLFYKLLRAPTFMGRKIMDKIEGFKMYLSVAEKDRLNLLNPPEMTPELFEKYLPFALALDVEQQWSEQFADVLKQALEHGRGYQPGWYSGTMAWNHISAGSFASGLGSSLSGAISSSSTAPGSSSGSGGSSGGGSGGGGGGGGGW